MAGGAVKGASALVIESTLVNCRRPPAPCTPSSCTLSCSTGRSSSPTEMTAERAAQKMQGARGSDAASDSICGGAVGLVAQPGRRARSPFTLSMSKRSVLGYLVGLCGAPRAVWCVRDNFGLTAPGRPGCVEGGATSARRPLQTKKIFSRAVFLIVPSSMGAPPAIQH